jgi:hypothetical protein
MRTSPRSATCLRRHLQSALKVLRVHTEHVDESLQAASLTHAVVKVGSNWGGARNTSRELELMTAFARVQASPSHINFSCNTSTGEISNSVKMVTPIDEANL